jgi:hypothetical protein
MPQSFNEPPPQPRPGPSGKVDRRALLQAYQDVVRTTKQKPAPKRSDGPDRRPFWTAVGSAIAGLSALLVFQPSWMFNRPPAEPPQLQEASLRIRMYVEIDRVDRFKAAKGRLPTNLLEAGGDSTGLKFERRGGGFILSGNNGVIQLRYRSDASPEAFLGNSYQLIRGRGK